MKKYICIIKNDPENYYIRTLEEISKNIIENWDVDTELKIAELATDFKITKIKTSIEL